MGVPGWSPAVELGGSVREVMAGQRAPPALTAAVRGDGPPPRGRRCLLLGGGGW
jgi:hypothetical protein